MAPVTFERTDATSRRRDRPLQASAKRLSRPPRPGAVDFAVVLAGLGLGASVALALTAETWSELTATGGIAMFIGNLTGLAGTYLALVMILLVSRIPVVERTLGQDRLLAWHRRLAPWPISLIVAHAVFLTIGYAQSAHTGVLHELGTFVSHFPGMLVALIGFGILVVIAVLSIYSVRRRLKRETWWAIHLGMYLAFALAFAHEVVLGPSFVNHPLTQVVWSAAWAATAGVVLTYRFGLPIYRSLRYRLRVTELREEADGITSIILEGRNLDRLAISGGQFFEWRFLKRGLWWQAHPYTVSARPRPPYMRLTVKSVGDHSRALSRLQPGTKVLVEGPYGAFTAHARRHQRAALLTNGIGVTAVRSLLEDLPKRSQPVVVWRVASEAEAALADEVRQLVSHLGGKFHLLAGKREDYPLQKVVGLVPDLRTRDLYVSGSESFVKDVVDLLYHQGVAREAIRSEVYAL